jgi:hypothetical protein
MKQAPGSSAKPLSAPQKCNNLTKFCLLKNNDDQQHFNLPRADALGTTASIALFYRVIRLKVREKNALFTVVWHCTF